MEPAGTGALVEPLVRFAAELRARGLDVGAGRVEVALRALGCVDARSIEETYWALRCAMLARHEDAPAFDEAFEAFWRGPPAPVGSAEDDAAAQQEPPGRESRGEAEGQGKGGAEAESAISAEGEEHGEGEADAVGARFSSIERLREVDFREWGPEELRAARPLMDRIARALPRRRSRRLRSGSRGRAIDRRGTQGRAMRTGGYPLELMHLERRTTLRRMLLLVDVSGSMEPYARPLLGFCQAVRRASPRAEVFAFGTRLTRLTRELGERDPERALRRAAAAVPDWAGGTRIGENLHALNASWGGRGVARGAIAIIFSDGWERGDTQTLSREMERLQRAAQAVVWVNPLAGEPGYEPLAAGMAAALPHVDLFLPGHDLASLERLAEMIELVADQTQPPLSGHRGADPRRSFRAEPLPSPSAPR